MISNRSNTSRTRRWATGVSLAGGAAVAAAMIGTAGAPAAHADDLSTDIGLLNAAETDVTDGFNIWTTAYGEAPPSSADLTQTISQMEAIQTPLLSSDNSLLSGFGEALFNGPDQQLAQAGDAFLTAAEAYAADPSTTTGLATAEASLQFDGSLFGSLPSTVIGELVDHAAGFDIGSAAAAADVATSATPTPDAEIGQTISALNETTTILEAAPTTDLGTHALQLVTGGEALPGQLDPILTQFESLQDELTPTDQTLVGYVDELMVSSAQNLVSADQAFVAADEAGEVSGNSVAPAELEVLGGALGFLDGFLTADGATLFADLTGGLDLSSAADVASSLDPSAVVDPSIFTDVLSSIGL
jgi:hypothetical protein